MTGNSSAKINNESDAPDKQMESGAVTFLDVLGWKGIWLRRSPREVVRVLEKLVRLAESTATEQRGRDGLASEVRVLSISDTIVLLTSGKASEVLPVHGFICQSLLCESIKLGIPIRGATTYGSFSASSGTILVGPAVDEAASWHEALDWIGVILTPTAEYTWSPTSPWFQYKRAPVKLLGTKRLWCVDWRSNGLKSEEIKELFAKAGPLDTTIAGKYMNTVEFFNYSDKETSC